MHVALAAPALHKERFFDANGVPLAGVAAPVTAIAEIILGVALIAGIATRVAALALASITVGAIIWVKNDAILDSDRTVVDLRTPTNQHDGDTSSVRV